MAQFDYETTLKELCKSEIADSLRMLSTYKGKQAAYETIYPDELGSLVEVAKIQSTSMSNKIENISTSNERLAALMKDKAEPKNRDEREIAGYRYVLDLIHESYDAIPVTPNVILQLHRDLYRFEDSSFAGKWKDTDNVIAERTEDEQMVARFRPTSAAATPIAMDKICNERKAQLQAKTYDPLLISLVWIFDFVSIHPFNDGNGRMSRLLTLLLLYKNGHTVGKYISIEKEIERTKETYYEALAASSVGWQDGTNDYQPFVTYMLGVLTSCYKELDQRMALLRNSDNNYELLRTFLGGSLRSMTKREIAEANPSISQRTIERILKRLQNEGLVEKVGAARATAYRWKG